MRFPFRSGGQQSAISQNPGTGHASSATTLGQPFEICRPGSFVDNKGRMVEVTEADLREMATAYNPKLRRSPLVVGHPKMDDPAFGWVKELDYRDGALVATAEQVNQEFALAVQDGSYANRSAAFFRPGMAGNPFPDRHYLKHVGFLGAHHPAVDGLKPIEFSALDGDDLVVSLAGWDGAYRQRVRREVEEEQAVSLAAFEQQVRHSEQRRINRERDVANFLDDMIKQAIIRPTEKEEFVALASYLATDEEVIHFGVGEDEQKVNALELFMLLIKHRAPLVQLGEFKPRGGPVEEVTLAMPDGVAVDTSRSQIHAAATAYQQKHNCSYRDAVRAVTGGGK